MPTNGTLLRIKVVIGGILALVGGLVWAFGAGGAEPGIALVSGGLGLITGTTVLGPTPSGAHPNPAPGFTPEPPGPGGPV